MSQETEHTADSAGQPWAGRRFSPNPSGADDGSAPPELLAVLDRFRSGTTGEADVIDVIRGVRLLIPLIAHLGEAGEDEHGRKIDKTQELAIVTVEGPDGRTVLPAFSSVTAMQHWNAKARPVPVEGARVALAAVQENTDLVVLDATSDSEFALRRPALWAIGQSQPWLPSYLDPAVADAFAASIGTELLVHSVSLESGDPQARLAGPELIVALTVTPGLSERELEAVLQRLARRWAASDIIATRVDSMTVRLVAA